MPLSVDTTSNLLKGLKILQSLGEAIPHGGGIIKAIAGIGITVLETAERVRVNREECQDIAERVARQILLLNSQLNIAADGSLSDDLRERLQAYLEILEEVVESVERLLLAQTMSRRMCKIGSIQDQTKECLQKLDDAYRTFMIRTSVALDAKLTTIESGMRSLSLGLVPAVPRGLDEVDEIPRISMRQIEFGKQISCLEKRTHILRIEHGELVDLMGTRKAVILRRFEVKSEMADEDQGFEDFKREVDLRRDLLNQHFSRMLGTASSSTGRTRMILIEASSIPAYDYLQSLSGVDYFLEEMRIMCEFVAGYRFLREHRGSWRGGYRDVLLSAKDKRLCMGGLGKMDSRWEDSGLRMSEAFGRLRDGDNGTGAGRGSFEEYADLFERMRESVSRWSKEETEANARYLWNRLGWWSGSSESEPGTENPPSVGEIGWFEGNVWYPISLVHDLPLAQPLRYNVTASRWCDGEWETSVGTQIEGFTRWSIDISPHEEVRLQTYVRSDRRSDVFDFFLGSALSLAREFGVDVCSLRQVSRTGLNVNTSLMLHVSRASSTVYYFAYPPTPDGSVPGPPGFWSFSPDPDSSDQHLQADAAEVAFDIAPHVRYDMINNQLASLLQDLDSLGFLPLPPINPHATDPPFASFINPHATDLPFASVTEASDQQATKSTIAKRLKTRLRKLLRSASTAKNRKTA